MGFYIAGTGSALPAKIVSNDDLSKIVDTSDEWIRTRTGIRNRRVITDETLTGLSAQAARAALSDAGVSAADVDLMICCTIKGDAVTPSQACLTAAEIGVNAMCFDVNAACTSMLYAFDIVDSFMRTGKSKCALVITCEAMSKLLDWTDRGTCVLFGDGAAAVVLREGKGLIAESVDCVPNSKYIYAPSYDGASVFATVENRHSKLYMDGHATYKFAVTEMAEQMKRVLDKAGLTIDDIDHILPHQANLRIIEAARKHFDAPEEKVLTNIASYGNMSATSIAVLLDENARAGKFKKGDKLLLVAFGAGMTAAAAIIEWNK